MEDCNQTRNIHIKNRSRTFTFFVACVVAVVAIANFSYVLYKSYSGNTSINHVFDHSNTDHIKHETKQLLSSLRRSGSKPTTTTSLATRNDRTNIEQQPNQSILSNESKSTSMTKDHRNLQAVVQIRGELRMWHKVTLAITGPYSYELNSPDGLNPFTDYNLMVQFVYTVTNRKYTVPGYFAADGNAAETGANEGTQWFVHFAPDQSGIWTYKVDFKKGRNIATQTNLNSTIVTPTHGFQGVINILPTDKTGRDHRGKGRLVYSSKKHHYRFAQTGEYFLKAGSDSPENFLAYEDFDNTPNEGLRRKSWAPHIQHYATGDPTWKGDKGKGIIGAINYLSNQGMNAFSFLTMNVNGDDKNVFPYISNTNRMRFDVSKLAQWEIVFEHADKMGMMLHFKTFEQENDQLLDGGDLGLQRKLYYRELVARFSHHLALQWNLGEEISNTIEQIKLISNYIKLTDPYDHAIVAHTNSGSMYLTALAGHNTFNGVSLQASPSIVYNYTLRMIEASDAEGRDWVVSNDEQNNARTGVLPDYVDPNHDDIRQNALWGNIMAGGAGVEYYFGYSYDNSDLTCQNFTTREIMWKQSKHALDFFQMNNIPFQDMKSSRYANATSNARLSSTSDWLLSLPNDTVHVIYRKVGIASGNSIVGLLINTEYDIKWYNPRTGGTLQDGTITSILIKSNTIYYSYGSPPSESPNLDLVVLIRKK